MIVSDHLPGGPVLHRLDEYCIAVHLGQHHDVLISTAGFLGEMPWLVRANFLGRLFIHVQDTIKNCAFLLYRSWCLDVFNAESIVTVAQCKCCYFGGALAAWCFPAMSLGCFLGVRLVPGDGICCATWPQCILVVLDCFNPRRLCGESCRGVITPDQFWLSLEFVDIVDCVYGRWAFR